MSSSSQRLPAGAMRAQPPMSRHSGFIGVRARSREAVAIESPKMSVDLEAEGHLDSIIESVEAQRAPMVGTTGDLISAAPVDRLEGVRRKPDGFPLFREPTINGSTNQPRVARS